MNYKISEEDLALIEKITERVIAASNDEYYDRQDMLMNLHLCHVNGAPLKLQELLEADWPNFIHDVDGISRHLCRETGELLDCFTPRFAA